MSTTLAFTVQSWSAWSSSKPGKSYWQKWAQVEAVEVDPTPQNVSFVPAMQRRRMSSLSKMVFATANECVAERKVQPNCIFASRHGELSRTMKIINAIVSGGDVSPTDFSASVHSTALGLYSIFTGNKNPSSMVVAGDETFTSALLEACVYLQRFPKTPVLVVYFDEPLPAPLDAFEAPTQECFCLALLLSAAENEGVQVSMKRKNVAVNQGFDGANLGEAFLKFFLSGVSSLEAASSKALWQWSRS